MRGVRRIVGRWYMLQVARLHRIPSPACVGLIDCRRLYSQQLGMAGQRSFSSCSTRWSIVALAAIETAGALPSARRARHSGVLGALKL